MQMCLRFELSHRPVMHIPTADRYTGLSSLETRKAFSTESQAVKVTEPGRATGNPRRQFLSASSRNAASFSLRHPHGQAQEVG